MRYTNLDEHLRDNMNAVGFLNDDNRREFDTNFTHTFWFSEFGIESIETDTNYNQYHGQNGVLRSWELDTGLDVQFRNKWSVEFTLNEELEVFEEDFRNSETAVEVGYDTRQGRSFFASWGFGRNLGSDLRLLRGGTSLKISDAWNASYSLTRLWLDPDPEEETTWIHVVRSSYNFTPDLFLRVFFQTNTSIDKKNAQISFVWRFIPPFGALQVAYQRGTSRFRTASDQGNTIFTKLSWLF